MPGMRCDLKRRVIEPDGFFFPKQAPAAPAVTFGPERQCREIWRFADRCPGICIVWFDVTVQFLRKIDEQRPVGRNIAAPFIDSSMKPLPVLERIIIRMPQDQLKPVRRTTPQNYCFDGFTGKDNQEAS